MFMEVKKMSTKKNTPLGNDLRINEVSSDFPEERKIASGKAETGKVINTRFVSLRKSPSSSSSVLEILSFGDSADILERLEGFYKIKTKKSNRIGFISSNYFKED